MTRVEKAELHPETFTLSRIERILYAGAHLETDALTTQQWLAIAEIREIKEARRWLRTLSSILPSGAKRSPAPSSESLN